MSAVIEGAVKALSGKISSFDGSAKFVVEGEGAIMIDESGVRAGDEVANVTLTASRDTFEGILNGDTNPTMAYMTGKLKIDGSLPEAWFAQTSGLAAHGGRLWLADAETSALRYVEGANPFARYRV